MLDFLSPLCGVFQGCSERHEGVSDWCLEKQEVDVGEDLGYSFQIMVQSEGYHR